MMLLPYTSALSIYLLYMYMYIYIVIDSRALGYLMLVSMQKKTKTKNPEIMLYRLMETSLCDDEYDAGDDVMIQRAQCSDCFNTITQIEAGCNHRRGECCRRNSMIRWIDLTRNRIGYDATNFCYNFLAFSSTVNYNTKVCHKPMKLNFLGNSE